MEFTLPDHDHATVALLKIRSVPSVAFDLGSKLGLPELLPGFRSCGVSAPLMAMPETAMHKNNRSVLQQHDVWATGKILSVQAEPKTHGVQDPAVRQFRSGVFSSYHRHVAGSRSADGFLYGQ